MIRIGPAGWSCRDWEGIVYPRQKRFDQLRYLSGFFPTIEVNSTFYGPPRARITQSWIERTDHVPDFRFTLKLGRNFTHQRGPLDEVEIQQWKEGAAPLGEAGKLGALLVQDVYIIYNNHFQGQAVVNALQLRHRLEGRIPKIPELLASAYPEMNELAKSTDP